MGVIVGNDRTYGTRVGVLEADFRISEQPVTEIIVSAAVCMKDTAFPIVDSSAKSEEDMRGFFTAQILPIESSETCGQSGRREEDEDDKTNQPDENEDDIGQCVDRIFAETNNDRW